MNSFEYELIGSIIHSFEEHYYEVIVVIDEFEPLVQVNRNPLENIQILEVKIEDLDRKLSIYHNQFTNYQLDSNFDLKETFGLYLKENLKSKLIEIAESLEKEKQDLEEIGEYPELGIDIINENFPQSIHDFFQFLITCEVLEKLKGYVDVWNKLMTKSDNWEKIKKGLLEKEWLQSSKTKYLNAHHISEGAYIDHVYLYIESWINRSVTLKEWEANEELDFWNYINLLGINQIDISLILKHQKDLLDEYIKRESDLLKIKYLKRTPNLIELAKFNFNVLERFLYGGDKSKSTLGNLCGIRRFKIEDFELILVEFQNILIDGKYKINNHLAGYGFGNRHIRPSLVASIFKNHYDFLKKYIASNENKLAEIKRNASHLTPNNILTVVNNELKVKVDDVVLSKNGTSDVESKLPKIQKKASDNSKPKIPFSFELHNYTRDHSKLKNVHKALIDSDFIHKTTPLTNFKIIFSGNEVKEKIKWDSDIKFLRHFILKLKASYPPIIKKVKDRKHWDVTVQCFENEDGEPYTKQKLIQNNTKLKESDRSEFTKLDEIITMFNLPKPRSI
jgi:hypothetical protein